MNHRVAAVSRGMIALALTARLLAAQGANLPPPDSSRPPTLSTLTRDSALHTFVRLEVSRLQQAIQAGDSTTIRMMTSSLKLSEPSESLPAACSTLASTAANVAQRLKTEANGQTTFSRAFLNRILLTNSLDIVVVRADLALLPPGGRETTTQIAFFFRGDGSLMGVEGVSTALCSLLDSESP